MSDSDSDSKELENKSIIHNNSVSLKVFQIILWFYYNSSKILYWLKTEIEY